MSIGLLFFCTLVVAASFQDELELRQKRSNQQISRIGKQISSRSLLQCSKLAPRTECFLKVVRQKTLTAPYEYLSFALQITDLVKADIAEGKLTKSESLLTLSDCLLTLLERVDLKKGWLAAYKSNAFEVRLVESEYRNILEKAKAQVIEQVSNNLVQWAK